MLLLSVQYEPIVQVAQLKLMVQRLEKSDLLGAIERLRNKQGDFQNPQAQDDLKAVADILQKEIWGNTDRKTSPDNNSGRTQEQSEEVQERKIQKLIDAHPDDLLEIIVLHACKSASNLEQAIAFHRRALKTRHLWATKRLPLSTPKQINCTTWASYLISWDPMIRPWFITNKL